MSHPDDRSGDLPGDRYCKCADPENCTQTVPGYICRKGSARSEYRHTGPFSYEFIKGQNGDGGHYRIRDAKDNALCFCYSEFNAQDVVRLLNASVASATERIHPSEWRPVMELLARFGRIHTVEGVTYGMTHLEAIERAEAMLRPLDSARETK